MQPHWTLSLKTGLKVNVPADLDNPVTLTLLELEDWPEPEHAFCRQLAQPGQRLLDADTGYGLYALSFAQALHGQGQGQGRVLALNPDPLFARSVADHGLQALIDIEAETPTRHANRAHRADQDHRDAGSRGEHHQPGSTPLTRPPAARFPPTSTCDALNMRLSEQQTQHIVRSVQQHLGPASRIWLFGSRLDDAKKGGDIDLFVETEQQPLRNELRCKIELEETLDMPVDLIVRGFDEQSPIAGIAKSNGHRL